MKADIKRRELGKTGLKVTELSYGAMNLRELKNIDQAYQILDYVLDKGINLIDTARVYNGENGEGDFVESEVLVGNVIRRRDDLKEPIVIITKGHGYTIPALEEELAISLDKLGIEGKGNLKIGKNDVKLVYFFHGINKERWASICKSGVLDRVCALKKEGVINYIGFSSHYAQKKEIKKAIDTDIFDVCELPYNIFNRSLGEDGDLNLLKYANDNKLGIINMKAFSGNGMVPIYNTLKDYISIDYRMMLNFCLSNQYISTVDAGAKYINEFELDISTALGKRLSEEEIVNLKGEADKVSPYMKNICRECMHCLEKFECIKGIDFPGILGLYSRYLINKNLDRDTSQFRDLYKEFSLTAEQCIECGQCLPWCEYKLNIPDMLKEAHRVLS